MTKFFSIMFILGVSYLSAEPVNVDPEIVLEELFSEEDMAAFKDKNLDDEELLFDEISQGENDPEQVLQ